MIINLEEVVSWLDAGSIRPRRNGVCLFKTCINHLRAFVDKDDGLDSRKRGFVQQDSSFCDGEDNCNYQESSSSNSNDSNFNSRESDSNYQQSVPITKSVVPNPMSVISIPVSVNSILFRGARIPMVVSYTPMRSLKFL